MARNPKPIRKRHQWRFPGQAKFRRAMARLEQLFLIARPGTPEGEEFEQLATFVSEWEAQTWGLPRRDLAEQEALAALLALGERECRLGEVREAKAVFEQVRKAR